MSPKRIARLVFFIMSLGLVMSVAKADSDPFPGIDYQGEIPGTRAPGQNGGPCATGSGLALVSDFILGEYSYCIKTWLPQATIDVEEDFRNRQQLATAEATIESQQYSAAHPGEQKCVTWGPVIHANGISTASGGVCANVVGTRSDGSTGQVAPTQVGYNSAVNSETSTASAVNSETSTASAVNSETSTASAVNSETTTVSAVSAETITVSAVSAETPTTKSVSTAQSNIATNKVRAIALNKSQLAANLSPGTIWCVPWTFETRSGRECSYQPIQNNDPFGPRANTVTVPTVIPSKTVGVESPENSPIPSLVLPNNVDTKTSVVVLATTIDSTTASTGQDFGGTIAQVKQAVNAIVEDTSTAKAINSILQKVSNLSKVTIKSSLKLPVTNDLEISIASNSASVCTVSKNVLKIRKSGNCKLEYSVSDADDNTFSINTIIKVKK